METQKNYENENFSQNKTKELTEKKEEKSLDEKFNELKKFLENYQEFNNSKKNFNGSINFFNIISEENNIPIYDKKGIFKILEKYLQKNINLKIDENIFKDIGSYRENIEDNYLKYLQKGGEKINEIEEILENTENNSKIIEIYFLINYFSIYEKIFLLLSEDKKQDFINKRNDFINKKQNYDIFTLVKEEEKNHILSYFNENSGLFLKNKNGELSLYKNDENFKIKTIKIKDFLPKNKYIENIFSEKNLDFETKIYFLKPNSEKYIGTPLNNNIIIFPKNTYGKEKLENYLNSIIANESMHIFLNNIGFKNINHNVFKENLGKYYEIFDNQDKISYIDEFLSDYSSIRSGNEKEIKRIINISFLYILDNNLIKKESSNYLYTAKFHSDLIEEILGKNISDYFKDFSELKTKYENLKGKKDILEKEKISKKINNFHIIIYQELENKIIIYNGKKINGIEYLIIKNQEKGDEIMERIYQNLQK